MIGAAGREQQAAGGEKTHRAQVDLLVAAQRGRQRWPRLRERWRVEHDGVEARPIAFARLEELEGIGLDECAVVESVAPEVLLGASQGVGRGVECGDPLRPTREMQREGAVIAEAVQCVALGDSPGECAVLALVEERARLLSAPGCGEVPDAVLLHFDLVRHGAVQDLDGGLQSLLHPKGHVVAREDPGRLGEVEQRCDDLAAESLEPGAHQLDDEPTVVSIDDEGREAVSLPVDETICVRFACQRAAALDGAPDLSPPPCCVDAGVRIAVEHSKRDLRARAPQGDAERFAALVVHAHGAGVTRRAFDDVATVDPWMACVPPARPLRRHDCCEHAAR